MADSTHEELQAHLKRWTSEGQPGFNANPIDRLNESVRWLCQRSDGLVAALNERFQQESKNRDRRFERELGGG